MPPSQTRRTDGVDGPRATFSKPRTTTGLTDRRQRQDIGEWGGEAGRERHVCCHAAPTGSGNATRSQHSRNLGRHSRANLVKATAFTRGARALSLRSPAAAWRFFFFSPSFHDRELRLKGLRS